MRNFHVVSGFWPRAAPRRGLYVSVNVSARQFADPGFAGTVREVLAASGLEPQALMLELTETAPPRCDGTSGCTPTWRSCGPSA